MCGIFRKAVSNKGPRLEALLISEMRCLFHLCTLHVHKLLIRIHDLVDVCSTLTKDDRDGGVEALAGNVSCLYERT